MGIICGIYIVPLAPLISTFPASQSRLFEASKLHTRSQELYGPDISQLPAMNNQHDIPNQPSESNQLAPTPERAVSVQITEDYSGIR